MSEMKSLTINGRKYDGFRDLIARELATTFAVINSVEGEIIPISDASDTNLRDLRIYGKTTQDGTPDPDAPVDIVSVGESGSLKLVVSGKNLLPYPFYQTTLTLNGITYTDNKNGTVFVSGTTTGPSSFWFTGYNFLLKKGVTYTLSVGNDFIATGNPYLWVNSSEKGIVAGIDMTSQKSVTFTPSEDYFDAGIYISASKAGIAISGKISPQIEIGAQATQFEKYKSKRLTISLPNGLPGIPVSSGGDYTDENGQQWICDEIDLARGVCIQRVLRAEVSASDFISVSDGKANARAFPQAPDYYKIGFCSHAKLKYTAIPEFGYCGVSPNGILVFGTDKTSLDDFRAWLGSDKIQVLVPTQAAPIETPLSEAELTAYAALYTYREHTTVSNDGQAYMELEYVMDAKKYIDSLVGGAAPGTGTIFPATVE